MVVGVVSDTHGDAHAMDALLSHPDAQRAEVWLHAGDVAPDGAYLARMAEKTVYGVAGNSDWPGPCAQAVEERIVALAGHRIFLTHGHLHGVRFTRARLVAAAREAGADIAVYGHTHIADLAAGAVTVLNPGSLARPRDAAEGSFALMDLAEGRPPRIRFFRMARSKLEA